MPDTLWPDDAGAVTTRNARRPGRTDMPETLIPMLRDPAGQGGTGTDLRFERYTPPDNPVTKLLRAFLVTALVCLLAGVLIGRFRGAPRVHVAPPAGWMAH